MNGRVPVTSHRPLQRRDRGAAMLIAVMAITAIAVIGSSVAVMATRTTRATGDSRAAAVAKDLANAGIAEGVTYLRQVGVTPAIDAQTPVTSQTLACATPTVTATPEWTKANAAHVSADAQGHYVVWIEKVAAPNGGIPGAYRICARSTTGNATRTASVLAQYTPAGGVTGPYAVYGKGQVHLQSGAQTITGLSVYSETCIDRKENKPSSVGGIDPSGRPAAAHSMLWVTGDTSCLATNSIHADGPVDGDFPYDTDRAGGPIGSNPDPVLHAAPWNSSTLEPAAQTVDQFRARWGVPDMLGPTSINALEQTAKQQGNYYPLTGASLDPVVTPNENNAVLFLDFQTHQSINLKDFNLGSWSQSCTFGKSLILVIRNADVEGNGNAKLWATVIIKNGGFTKLNGGFMLFGGLLADYGLDLSGTGEVKLDSCTIANPPPGGTPQVDVSNYIEYDRG